MFERYTEYARRTVFFARYEASQFGSPYIEPEHLLLGILREGRSILHPYFTAKGALEQFREEVEAALPKDRPSSTSVDLPLSRDAKKVLAFGAEEAQSLDQKYIGPGHLLLGILRLPQTLAARLLEQHGVTLDRAREERQATTERSSLDAGATFTAASPKPQAGHLGLSRVDDGSLVTETRRYFGGKEIIVKERWTLSEDGKSLHYAHEISGPGNEGRIQYDFDLS